MIIGAPLKGKVIVIDDVISAGTSVRESVKLIQAAGAQASGVLIALDRMEKGGNAEQMTEVSAVQDVINTFHMPVISIINLKDLVGPLWTKIPLWLNRPGPIKKLSKITGIVTVPNKQS